MKLDVEEAISRAREVGRAVLSSNASRTDREARWPQENFAALLAAGLGGLVVPTELGGASLGLVGLLEVCAELGRHCASTAISFGMHHVASAVIAAKATEEQREKYLLPIARGEHLTTLALSEPGTGAHFYLPQTRLHEEADGSFRVDGVKSFVTNAEHADSYVVSTAPADTASAGDFSCILVPSKTPGLDWRDSWNGLGMRGNASRSVALRDVRLPRGALLGKEGDQIWYVFHVVAPYFLTAMAGTYIGLAAAALDEAREHLLGRVQAHTGTSLAHQPILQHRFGALWARVASTQAFVRHAAALGDAGSPDALPALCAAKAEVATCAVDVTNEAMTLMGGQGYAADGRMHRLMRDARAAHVMSPTTDLLRLWTGRAVLGLPLLAE